MSLSNTKNFYLKTGDALVAIDVQNDFYSGGSLEVPGGDEIVPVMNQYIDLFLTKGLPVFATRDWHPENHISFKEQGGPWPVHCVAGSKGAQFHPELHLPDSTVVISTATKAEREAYSGFEETGLNDRLKAAGIRRLLIGGLATDYCVLFTVKDALKNGYEVILLQDAVRAVEVQPGDGDKAIEEMTSLGAVSAEVDLFT